MEWIVTFKEPDGTTWDAVLRGPTTAEHAREIANEAIDDDCRVVSVERFQGTMH